MTATLTTKQIKDAAGNIFLQRVVDVSGTGAGPFLPLHGLSDPNGSGPVDIEALVASLVTAIGTGATGAATAAKQDSLAAQIGEVQASPTADTVLDRLKTIATGLGSVVLAAGTSVIGKVGLQVAGADVSTGNPVPISAAALPLPTGAATAAQIGEVQASPTANTVLDRLKAIATGLGSVGLAAGTAVIGKVGLQVGGNDVSAANPLPSRSVGPEFQASGIAAVTGTIAAAGNSSAFSPAAGRQAYLTLSGGTSLSGAVQWSLDGGTTWANVVIEGVQIGIVSYAATTITIPVPTPEQAGAQLRLAASAASGTVSYSISQ